LSVTAGKDGAKMSKFRKKPVVIEARCFSSVTIHEQEMLADWCHGRLRGVRLPADARVIQIDTLEGEMEARFGDWIIQGVKGEFYPCKPDVFEATYEPA
jgi:hypothetical protein